MSISTITHALRTERSPRTGSAVAATVGFLVIAAFQVALALGAPLGRAAWGGTYTHLPVGLRVVSAIAVGVWVLAALVDLGRAGSQVSPLPPAFVRWGTWILVGVLPLGALMNFASPSGWERFFWGPVALVLAVLCFIVARGPVSPPKEADPVSTTSSASGARSQTLRRWIAFGLALGGTAALVWLSVFPVDALTPFGLTRDSEIGTLVTHQGLTLLMTAVIAGITSKLIPDAFRRYFRVGELDAPAAPVRVLGIRPGEGWKRVGTSFVVVVSLMTAVVVLLPAVAGSGFSLSPSRVVLALGLAVSNAFVEEYLTRFQVVASLGGTMPAARIAIVSGLVFGLAHAVGIPGGPVGVLLAGFLGWLLARSVLETRGLGCAWFIHFVQDVIIFVAVLGTA